jgi:hypothetical protein
MLIAARCREGGEGESVIESVFTLRDVRVRRVEQLNAARLGHELAGLIRARGEPS